MRGSEFDVTNGVHVARPQAVAIEVRKLCTNRFSRPDFAPLDDAFARVERLYNGEDPAYHGCDTWYHDLQHVLDVTLAMARLMDGYASGAYGEEPLDAELFALGIIVALFHDVGYLRRRHDRRHRYGAEYTQTHVGRGAAFLRDYLPQIGLGHLAQRAGKIVHFTNHHLPPAQIRLSPGIHRTLGNLLGSADMIAQMSDRCYLEKCRDRLYPEFVLGGLACRRVDGGLEVIYASGEDLVIKTPGFYEVVKERLETKLEGAYRLAEVHFDGDNPYVDEIDKNVRFARKIATDGDTSLLRRTPPRSRVIERFPLAAFR